MFKFQSLMKKIVLRNPENLVHRFNFNVLLQVINDLKIRTVLSTYWIRKEDKKNKLKDLFKICTKFYLCMSIYLRIIMQETPDWAQKEVSKEDSILIYSYRIKINLMEKIRDSSESKYQIIKAN